MNNKNRRNNNNSIYWISGIVLFLILLFSLNFILNKNNKLPSSNNKNSNNISSLSTLLSGKDFIAKYKSSENSILLDVRTPAEYEDRHISGAINIDYENVNFSEKVSQLDKNKTYFVYCRSGRRSAEAVKIMNRVGINNIYELKGGISINNDLLK